MKNKKAFTLVELVIAVVIVGILSGIAGPIYKNYALEAKRTEGYALLERILNEERKYYAEYEEFYWVNSGTGGLSCYIPAIGVDARQNKYFTAYAFDYGSGNNGRDKITVSARSAKYGTVILVHDLTAGGPVYRVEGL